MHEPCGMDHPPGIESARHRPAPFLKSYPGSSTAVSGSQVTEREVSAEFAGCEDAAALRSGKRSPKPKRLLAVRRN